jgi:kynurenine formamidase
MIGAAANIRGAPIELRLPGASAYRIGAASRSDGSAPRVHPDRTMATASAGLMLSYVAPSPAPEPVDLSADQFSVLFQGLSTWGRWGDGDEAGALHYLRPERVAAAARLIRDGVTISLSWPLDTVAAAHNPHPAEHRMTTLVSSESMPGSAQFAKDYIGLDYHSETHTHIDALCHVAHNGMLYNGKAADLVDARGASAESIEVLKNGLVGRGVLLDIPRLRGVPWLEPGESVDHQELEAAEIEQGLTVQEGDILLVRTGHARRLAELGPWETAKAMAGLHPMALTFVADRGVAALGSDGNSDTVPSTTEDVAFPIHVLAITAMGVHLLDYLWLEDLAGACERSRRWEFFFTAAPLRITGGTGSPLNPVAIF